tara:strand:- start:68 stop:439 length:372 start_codon:yes stop_codon:yes gene_type:complete
MLNRSLLISFFLVTGCQSTPSGITSVGGKTVDVVSDAASGGPLAVLSIAGGLCLLAGMVLLVITRGQKGWYPSVGGVLLCLLNYMVLKYDDLIFYPLVILTGMISAAWTYRVVTQILTEKKSK